MKYDYVSQPLVHELELEKLILLRIHHYNLVNAINLVLLKQLTLVLAFIY